MDKITELEVIQLIHSGRKIQAIKKLREVRSCGLKEAKELVDAYNKENNSTTPSVIKVESKGGWLTFIAIIVLGYLVYHFFAG